MAAVAYDMCMTTGHGPYPPTPIKATQSKFFVGGIPVIVNGDEAQYHGHSPVGKCIASSTKVFVSGKAVVQIGDSLSDGDHVAQGSPKVFIR